MIDHDGSILSVYDKVHLVPFGEYLPFQDFLERLGLMQLTKVRGGYIPGDRRRKPYTCRARRAFLPLICYEIDFPGRSRAARRAPGLAASISPTTAGSAVSSGPYQHLQQARVRAIEEGLPLVRAANTGISAVVDPLGRIVRSLAARDRRRAGCAVAASRLRRHSMRASATALPLLLLLFALAARATPAASRVTRNSFAANYELLLKIERNNRALQLQLPTELVMQIVADVCD